MDDNQLNDDNTQDAGMLPTDLDQVGMPGDVASHQLSDNRLQSQIQALPMEASDVDLIEKEWVHHLKHIVEQTLGNPYRQQLEISHAKADYLKKRYGKEIKVNGV